MDFFTPENLQKLAETHLVPFALNLLAAAVVFWLGRLVAKLIAKAIRKLCTRAQFDDALGRFLSDIAYALLLAVVAIAALDRLGVPTTSAVAVIGAAGLAVGFALQSSLGNFASGVMIILFEPYKPGDVVKIGGEIGTVREIQIFNTVLHTGDNRVIMIPNGKVTADKIENINKLGQRRVDMIFGIGYGDNMGKAKELIEGILQADERVLSEPAPVVAVGELADSSINFVVRPWCKAEHYWAVLWDTTQKIKEVFDENGVEIPFPQRDVHLYQMAAERERAA